MGIADDLPMGNKTNAHGQTSGSRPFDAKDGCLMFGWLWDGLSTTLGTPAAAALMRRAVSAASTSHPDLRGIVITRERLTYSYTLPEELCSDNTENSLLIYRALVWEVLRLTGELTGGVMLRGLVKREELSPWLPDMQEVDKWLSLEG